MQAATGEGELSQSCSKSNKARLVKARFGNNEDIIHVIMWIALNCKTCDSFSLGKKIIFYLQLSFPNILDEIHALDG